MRWRLILAAVLLVPVVEIAVLVAVGQLIGIGWALLATLVTSALGGVVIQREGRRSLRRLRKALRSGRAQEADSSDSALRMAGGIALFIPGLVTDLVGLVLLAPPARWLARRWLLGRLDTLMSAQAANQVFGPRPVRVERASPHTTADGEVIEGEVVDPTPDNPIRDNRGTG